MKEKKIKVGLKFHYYDRDLWHVVNLFKDGDTDFAVIKSWAKYKQRWCYKVEAVEWILWYLEQRKD